ncbi:MAG: AtpZ/AtpI family protein [Bacteroidales bacterium]
MEPDQSRPENLPENRQKQKKPLDTYVRYSSLAFQMIFIILLGVFGGMKLDKWLQFEFPVFTFVLTILAVAFSIYYAVRDLIRLK